MCVLLIPMKYILEDPSVWFLWLMTLQACEGGGYLYEAQFLTLSLFPTAAKLANFRFLIWSNKPLFEKIESWIAPLVVIRRKNCLGAIPSWIWVIGVVEFAYLELYPLAMRLWFCAIALSREDPKKQGRVFDISAAVFFRFSNGCWYYSWTYSQRGTL